MIPLCFNLAQRLIRQFDSYAFDGLANYTGESIQIQIHQIGCFELCIQGNHLKMSLADGNSQPTCRISGSISAYLDMIFQYQQFVPGRGLTISGRVGVAKALFECIENLDPDFATTLEKYLPKPVVALVSQWYQNFKSTRQSQRDSRARDLKSYLQDETELLVPNELFDDFKQDIRSLKQRVQQLERGLYLRDRTQKSALCSE